MQAKSTQVNLPDQFTSSEFNSIAIQLQFKMNTIEINSNSIQTIQVNQILSTPIQAIQANSIKTRIFDSMQFNFYSMSMS